MCVCWLQDSSREVICSFSMNIHYYHQTSSPFTLSSLIISLFFSRLLYFPPPLPPLFLSPSFFFVFFFSLPHPHPLLSPPAPAASSSFPRGGPLCAPPGALCVGICSSGQRAYQSSLPRDVMITEVTSDGGWLPGPPQSQNSIFHTLCVCVCVCVCVCSYPYYGAGTHRVTQRTGTHTSGAAVCHCSNLPLSVHCSAGPLNPPQPL